MKTTIVSALFCIRDGDGRPVFAYKNELYKSWCENLLRIRSPMVIHTDDHFYSVICAARRRTDPDFTQTVVVERTIAESTSFKLFHANVASLMSGQRFKRLVKWPDTPEMREPLYNVVIFDKLALLNEVASSNPFDSEIFCWVDMGGIRHPVPPNLEWPTDFTAIDPNRVNMFAMSYRPEALFEGNMRDYFLSQWRFIQGRCFLGRRAPLAALQRTFHAVVRECLAKGFIASEEKVFDFCHLRWPDLLALQRTSPPDEWGQFFHLLSGSGTVAEHEITIELEPRAASARADVAFDFWYVAVHDERGNEIFRRDLSGRELEDVANQPTPRFQFKYRATRPAHTWTVWPHDAERGWLEKITGEVCD